MRLNSNVILFTHIKTDFLVQIMESILEYNPSKVYIVIDPSNQQTEKVLLEIFFEYSKKLDITFFRPKEHLGISRIFDFGMDEVFEIEDRIIILEDDTVPNQEFFHFCNTFLSLHETNKEISSIVGTSLCADKNVLKREFFLSDFAFPYWGWATWKDRWMLMPKNDSFMDLVLGRNDDLNCIQEIFLSTRGFNISWDIRWSMHQLQNGNKCIVSNQNLISNLGFGELSTFTKNKDSQFANLQLTGSPRLEEYIEMDGGYSNSYINRINLFLSEFK
jgi:hypothetical protein